MAIIDLAVRLATVMALRGKTLVGQNVFDEPLDPLMDALQGGTADQPGGRPLIAIYTTQTVANIEANDYLGAERDLEVNLQIYLPDSITVGGLLVDTRRSGAKLILDLIERQIERVLVIDDSPWAQLRRKLQFNLKQVAGNSFLVRAGSTEAPGPVIAAREFILVMDTISAPMFGRLEEPWDQFVALLRADAHLEPLADLIEAEITAPANMPDWVEAMAALGSLRDTPQALGIHTPALVPPEPVDPPVLDEIVVTDEEGDTGALTTVVDDGSIADEERP